MADYFTKDTDEAIKRFQLSENIEEKQRIFTDEIRPAFEKLIESLIYVYGFFFEDTQTLKSECLSNLYEILPKFQSDKGTKGFSYFNVVAKNWFIMKTRERAKKNRLEKDLYVDFGHETTHNEPNLIISPHEDVLEDKEKWLKFYEEMESWNTKLLKKQEREVLGAIIFIMKNPDLVTIYSKKAIFLYLREITGLNAKQVVINLKKIKNLYNEWNDKYCTTGEST